MTPKTELKVKFCVNKIQLDSVQKSRTFSSKVDSRLCHCNRNQNKMNFLMVNKTFKFEFKYND